MESGKDIGRPHFPRPDRLLQDPSGQIKRDSPDEQESRRPVPRPAYLNAHWIRFEFPCPQNNRRNRCIRPWIPEPMSRLHGCLDWRLRAECYSLFLELPAP